MEPNWDKKAVSKLKALGLSWEHARIAVGQIAEHRQQAYVEGHNKGFNDGYACCERKLKKDLTSAET